MTATYVTNAGVWFILAALITLAVLGGIGAALVHRHDTRVAKAWEAQIHDTRGGAR